MLHTGEFLTLFITHSVTGECSGLQYKYKQFVVNIVHRGPKSDVALEGAPEGPIERPIERRSRAGLQKGHIEAYREWPYRGLLDVVESSHIVETYSGYRERL